MNAYVHYVFVFKIIKFLRDPLKEKKKKKPADAM